MRDLFIDIDGTCVDFIKQFLDFYNKEHECTLSPEDMTTYNITEFCLYLKKDDYRYLDDINFYKKINWFPHAIYSIAQLFHSNKFNLHFVTTCVSVKSLYYKSVLLQSTFQNWFDIRKHFIAIDDKRKLLHKNSIIIDDNSCVLSATSHLPGKVICFAAPYNKEVQYADLRTNDWKLIKEYLTNEN